jgi:FkbM family methyltransferase
MNMQRVLPSTEELVAETVCQLEHRQVHDADFSILGKFARSGTDVLDVGANRGQSIVSLSLVTSGCRIHSFEANPMLHPVVKTVATLCQATFHSYGLGDGNATLPLYIPWAQGTCYLEEASTSLEYFELPWVAAKFVARGGLELQPVDITIRIGDDLRLQPSLIKVDVEGSELRVIRGLAQTIREYTPALLVENSDWHNVTAFLKQLDYAPFMIVGDTYVPLAGECTNTLYLKNG